MDIKGFLTKIGLEHLSSNQKFITEYEQGFVPQIIKFRLKEHSNEKDVILFAVEDGFGYEIVGSELKGDKDIAMKLVARTPGYYKEFPADLRADEDITRLALTNGFTGFSSIPEEFRARQDLMILPFIGSCSLPHVHQLPLLPETVLADTEFATAVLTVWGVGLDYFPEQIRDDKELVKVALQSSNESTPYTFESMSDRLKNDREIVEFALQLNGHTLKKVPTKFKKDRELVGLAVKTTPAALQYASKALRCDQEIISVALSLDGRAINHVPEEAITKDLAITAVSQTPMAYRFLPDEFKNDFEVCLKTFQKDYSRTTFCTIEMKGFLNQYGIKQETLAAIRTAVNLQAKKVHVPLDQDVYKIKETVDLAERLQANLTKKPEERKLSAMRKI